MHDYKENWTTLQRILEDTDTLPLEESKTILKLMNDIKEGRVKQ